MTKRPRSALCRWSLPGQFRRYTTHLQGLLPTLQRSVPACVEEGAEGRDDASTAFAYACRRLQSCRTCATCGASAHSAAASCSADALPLHSWRVDVVLSTSSVSRVLRPSVLLRATLTDGTVATFELNARSFHELRHAVAEALHSTDSATPKLAALVDAKRTQRGRA